jgi:hypothetical protein
VSDALQMLLMTDCFGSNCSVQLVMGAVPVSVMVTLAQYPVVQSLVMERTAVPAPEVRSEVVCAGSSGVV